MAIGIINLKLGRKEVNCMPSFCVRPGQVVMTHLTHVNMGQKGTFKATILRVHSGGEDEFPHYRIRRHSDGEKFTVSFEAIQTLRKQESRNNIAAWHERMKQIGK